jgi:glycosyltransferase involved in cell wall biosynthesis
MKILLVNDLSTLAGGAEISILILRNELRRRGHDARIFASSAQDGEGERFADYECFGTTSGFRTLLQSCNPFAFWRLRQVLAEFKPDVVDVKLFLTQLSPSILPVLRNIPALYDVNWLRPICPLGTKMLPDRTLCRTPAGWVCYKSRCLPMRDWIPLMLQMKLWRRWRSAFRLVVAHSEAVKLRLLEEGIGSVEVVPHGIPDAGPRPPLSEPPTVAFAGRLVPEKGTDLLLRAFAKVREEIPSARLLAAGEGKERANLEKLARELKLGPAASFLGKLTREEMERAFAPAWVQAVPSIWEEPFGMVAVEAMMRGTAVVASNRGGLAEIVQDGQSGTLVPPGDPDSLGQALIRLLRNRELAEEMGRKGREIARTRFGVSVFVDRWVQLYEKLLQ